MKEALTFRVDPGQTGLVFVTCDQIRGLLVAERSLSEALAAIEPALNDLASAGDQTAIAATGRQP